MFGELYLEGVYDNAERGPMAIICGRGIDGNVADVYGETREDASMHALYIIHSVNDRVEREAQSRMTGTNVREMTSENQIECEGCGALVCFSVDFDEGEVEEAWNKRQWRSGMENPEITMIKLFPVLEDTVEMIDHLLQTNQTGPMSDTGYEEAMGKVARIKARIAEIKSNRGITAAKGDQR